jgi:hypothetical protein
MEVGLLGFLIVTALLLVLRDPGLEQRRDRVYFAIVTVLLVSTRLDAVIPIGIVCAGAVLLARPARRGPVALLGFGSATVAIAIETLARRLYYGDFLPNTYYLKMSQVPAGVRVEQGWDLLRGIGITNFGPYLLLAVPSVIVAIRRRDLRYAPLLGIVVATAAYHVWVGGDAFEELGFANRFLTTAAPVLMVLAGVGVAELFAATRTLLRTRVMLLAGTLALLLWYMARGGPDVRVEHRFPYLPDVGQTSPLAWVGLGVVVGGAAAVVAISLLWRRSATQGVRFSLGWMTGALLVLVVLICIAAANEVQYRHWAKDDVAAFEQQLALDGVRYKSATRPEARIAFGAAGAASYFSNRSGIDLLGLSDAHIARQAPRGSNFKPGHSKYDYTYSIGRLKPDLVAPAIPVPHVAGYRVLSPRLDQVRIGSPNVDVARLRAPDPR